MNPNAKFTLVRTVEMLGVSVYFSSLRRKTSLTVFKKDRHAGSCRLAFCTEQEISIIEISSVVDDSERYARSLRNSSNIMAEGDVTEIGFLFLYFKISFFFSTCYCIIRLVQGGMNAFISF